MTSTDQQAVIDFLRAESTNGAGPVKVITTHVSTIFLSGQRALKMKRAVKFPFLDFRNLEARRVACEREVEINRRTAPSIYKGVLAVSKAPDGSLELGGTGVPVEWLVDMARFDEDTLFDRLAEVESGLRRPRIEALADTIADFHATAEIRSASGGHAGTRMIAENNARSFEILPAGCFDPNKASSVMAETLQRIDDLSAVLDSRRDAGRVRICHGDLHLGNICIFEDQPTLFDAIEFNDRIACCDLLYDLAFLVMDLWARGLHGHANRVINRYLWRTGDWQGLPLLPLFLSCRAAVRAKTSFWAQQVQENGEDAAQRRGEAQAYLQLALQALIRQPPTLLALGGLSGTGKTTLAMALAPERSAIPGALVVRSDVLRKQLAGVAFEERLGKEAYGPESNRAVYRKVEGMAGAVLDAGLCAIADAVYLRATQREAIAEVAAHRGLRFDGLWLEAPRHIMTQRVNARSGDASDADSAVVAFQASQVTDAIDWPRLESGSDVESVAVRARSLV